MPRNPIKAKWRLLTQKVRNGVPRKERCREFVFPFLIAVKEMNFHTLYQAAPLEHW